MGLPQFLVAGKRPFLFFGVHRTHVVFLESHGDLAWNSVSWIRLSDWHAGRCAESLLIVPLSKIMGAGEMKHHDLHRSVTCKVILTSVFLGVWFLFCV